MGVTTVKIIEVNEESLVVEGLDAIKGTPVLDIKFSIIQCMILFKMQEFQNG